MRSEQDPTPAGQYAGANAGELLRPHQSGVGVDAPTTRIDTFPERYVSRRPKGVDQRASMRSMGWSRLTSDGSIVVILTASVFLLYMAVSRHRYAAYDAQIMEVVTHNLVNHFS